MRITLIVFADFLGGGAVARRVHVIGKGLAASGHEVHVVIPQRFNPGPLFQRA